MTAEGPEAAPTGKSPALSVDLVAPAKLTLSLVMTGVRDDGFHLIDAEMVTLDLVDELRVHEPGGAITPGSITPGSITLRAGAGFVVDEVPLGPDNLVARALELLGRTASVEITKRIPPGAGLGGGSADAAAVLRWGGFSDLQAAGRLGADIPFCLIGGRARVSGIGDELESLPYVERTLTLLTPPFGCNTAAVYRAWDELGGPRGDHGNDLEPAALVVEPRLALWRDRLAELSGQRPRLAGSGSTWFVEGAFEGDPAAFGEPSSRPRGDSLPIVVRTTPAGWVPE